MALGDSYCSLDDFRRRIDETPTVISDDFDFTDVLSVASRGIEKTTLRQFNKATSATARQYYPTRNTLAFVDDFWTTSNLVIKLDLDDDGVFETTLSASDYQLEPLNGVVDGESGWPYYQIRLVGNWRFACWNRRPCLEVTAQWGWNAVPAPVKEVCIDAALEYFKIKDVTYQPTIRIAENPRFVNMLRPYSRQHLLVG